MANSIDALAEKSFKTSGSRNDEFYISDIVESYKNVEGLNATEEEKKLYAKNKCLAQEVFWEKAKNIFYSPYAVEVAVERLSEARFRYLRDRIIPSLEKAKALLDEIEAKYKNKREINAQAKECRQIMQSIGIYEEDLMYTALKVNEIMGSYRLLEKNDRDTEPFRKILKTNLHEYEKKMDSFWEAHKEYAHWKQLLANTYLKGVIYVAKKCKKKFKGTCGVPLHLLIQEGNIGLMRAAERFDYTRGTLFSSFAHDNVRQAVNRATSQTAPMKRSYVYSVAVLKLEKARSDLAAKGEKITPSALAKKLNWKTDYTKKIIEFEQTRETWYSIDAPVSKSSDNQNFLSELESNAVNPETIQDQDLYKEAYDSLPSLEKKVISMRYEKGAILEEIGNELGMTREGARQTLNSIIKTMKKRVDVFKSHGKTKL
jgi:RNA polymerase primary sigma factor